MKRHYNYLFIILSFSIFNISQAYCSKTDDSSLPERKDVRNNLIEEITIYPFSSSMRYASSYNDYLQPDHTFAVMGDTCKWLEDGAEWFHTPWSIDFYDRLAKIEIIGDTLIDDRLCSILGLFKEDEFVENSDLIVFYEKANEKVYFNEDGTFRLLYDFSPSVLPGDTVEFYLPQKFEYYDISSTGGEFLPTNQPYKYRNVSEELVTLPSGEQLRIVNTEPISDFEQEGEYFEMGRIISGVGSDRGFLGRNGVQLTGGKIEYFRCFQSNTLDYSEVEGECVITSTNEVISDDQVVLFPNPASDEIQVKTELEFKKVRIYDSSGRCIQRDVYSATINIETLSNGLYFLELLGNDGNYKTTIVKNGN